MLMAARSRQGDKLPGAGFHRSLSLPKKTEPEANVFWIWRDINCVDGTPGGTRTPDLLLRRQLLYPAELLARMERVMGIEPTPTAWKAVVLAVILHPQLL